MKSLTPKQRDTLEYIMFFLRFHGHPPTLRELAQRMDITHNAVRDRIFALEKKEYVRYDNSPRCIQVLRNPAGNEVRLRFEEVMNFKEVMDG
jgi:repressor LexA